MDAHPKDFPTPSPESIEARRMGDNAPAPAGAGRRRGVLVDE
jgi:hypothetical protein